MQLERLRVGADDALDFGVVKFVRQRVYIMPRTGQQRVGDALFLLARHFGCGSCPRVQVTLALQRLLQGTDGQFRLHGVVNYGCLAQAPKHTVPAAVARGVAARERVDVQGGFVEVKPTRVGLLPQHAFQRRRFHRFVFGLNFRVGKQVFVLGHKLRGRAGGKKKQGNQQGAHKAPRPAAGLAQTNNIWLYVEYPVHLTAKVRVYWKLLCSFAFKNQGIL